MGPMIPQRGKRKSCESDVCQSYGDMMTELFKVGEKLLRSDSGELRAQLYIEYVQILNTWKANVSGQLAVEHDVDKIASDQEQPKELEYGAEAWQERLTNVSNFFASFLGRESKLC